MPIEMSPDRHIISALMGMEIRDEIGYSYQKWIADKQGWTREYACRVFREYARFLYLCTKQKVTPSRDVDACWHGHLMHSRHYIEELPNILGRHVHHTPGRSGASATYDHDHWQDQYRQTLDLSASVFGEVPPEDIWPRPVTEKSQARQGKDKDMKMIFYCAVLAAGLIFMGANDVSTIMQSAITIGFLIFMLMVYIGNSGSRRTRARSESGSQGRGLRGDRRSHDGVGSNSMAFGSSADDSASGSLHYLHKDKGGDIASSDSHSWSSDNSPASSSDSSGSSCGGGCGGGD